MSESLPEEELDIVRRILTGDLRREEEPARSLLDRSPAARAELEQLEGVERRLTEIVEETADELHRAAAGTAEAGAEEERILAGFAEAAGAAPAQAAAPTDGVPRLARLAAVVTAVAATLLAVLFVLDRGGEDVDPLDPDIPLGPTVRLDAPAGAVPDYEEFRWTYELPAGGYFELLILDARAGMALDEVFASPRLREPRWRPGARLDSLPDEIRWEVTAFDAGGAVLATGSGEARRSP
ncbi:MAG: hypothetical protein AAF682_03030 [Planctomycetota bacterium]